MLELSTLAEINRHEGFEAGDRALQQLARSVERALTGLTATAGRFSGCRLAIVLPGSGHQGAAATAAQVADGYNGDLRTGVAVWQHGDHGSDVLARARLALADRPTVERLSLPRARHRRSVGRGLHPRP